MRSLKLIAILFLVAGCAGSLIKDEEKTEIDKLIQLYQSENWEVREKTIIKASFFNSVLTEDLMLKAMNDTHIAVRMEAINGLGNIRSYKAKTIIRQIAESDNSGNERWYALKALAMYRDPTSAPIFAKGLNSSDWIIREESIKGLLKIDDIVIKHISTPYIIKALDDPGTNVVITTLLNLNIKNEKIYAKIIEILTQAYSNSSNKINILKASLNALQGYELDKNARQVIIKLLTHSNSEVRLLSLAVLKKDKELQHTRRVHSRIIPAIGKSFYIIRLGRFQEVLNKC